MPDSTKKNPSVESLYDEKFGAENNSRSFAASEPLSFMSQKMYGIVLFILHNEI
jgi:hypothetical protein